MPGARLLICFAHPDDESFGLGAAIPKWIDDGVAVSLVCATNGDVGTVPDHLQAKHKSIAELRLSELECARQYLKFSEVVMLGYRDSGMTDSETSRHPDCLAYQWRHHPEAVTERVAAAMRRVRPQVVVTFNRYGGYGHPDHIAIQRAAAAAFHQLRGEDLPPSERPQKLYYTAFSTFSLRLGILKLRLRGQDPRRQGRNQDVDSLKTLENTEPVHTRIPIAEYLPIWELASRCHESQGGGRINRSSRLLRRWLYGKQGFTRAFPVPERDRVDEDDVFAGVQF